jgi:hypothetical protein
MITGRLKKIYTLIFDHYVIDMHSSFPYSPLPGQNMSNPNFGHFISSPLLPDARSLVLADFVGRACPVHGLCRNSHLSLRVPIVNEAIKYIPMLR